MLNECYSEKSVLVDCLLALVIVLLFIGIYNLQLITAQSLGMQEIKSSKLDQFNFQLLSSIGDTVDVDIIEMGKSQRVADVGDRVKIKYEVSFLDGTDVDSSTKKMGEEQFVVGFSRAIPGLDLGIRRIPIGSRARLKIPWRLAYGEEGLSNVIPPRTDLRFEILVLDIQPSGVPLKKPDITGLKTNKLESVDYWILKSGKGTKPIMGQSVHINYAVWDQRNKLIHSSFFNDTKYLVQVGRSPIPAWNQLLRTMSPGQQIFVKVPPEMALRNRKVINFDTEQTLYFWLEYVD